MFNHGGSFNGIDTCSMTNFGKFGFYSSLLNEAESRSIVNRPDINALINHLMKNIKKLLYVSNSKSLFARHFS